MSGKFKLRFLSAFRDFFIYHHKSLEFRAKIFAAMISAKFDPDEDDFFVLNDITTSPEQEMIEDLTSIIHVFSCRLYGLRKYKSKIKTDKEVISLGIDEKNSTISQSNNDKGT